VFVKKSINQNLYILKVCKDCVLAYFSKNTVSNNNEEKSICDTDEEWKMMKKILLIIIIKI
jgi:hypothetical protein